MPTVKLDLGRYVTVRPRKDGTARVLFEVPARLRPSDWQPAIPLPFTGERKGDLQDADEIKRIQTDAAALLIRLHDARLGRDTEPAPHTMRALNREWQSRQEFLDLKPATQKGYAYHAGLIVDWAESSGDKPVPQLRRKAIEDYLAFYNDRPTTKRYLKTVIKMMMDHAIALEWREDNPADRIKAKAPKVKLRIWEREDVMAGAWACVMAGQTPLGALLLTEWEIGQRLTDTRLFRLGAEYSAAEGVFRFEQSKTGQWVTIPVSDALRGLLACVQDPDSLYLFVDRATGKPFAEQRLGHVWGDIRERFGLDRRLQVRTLRHSCVVQLARKEVDIPGICSITRHTLKSAHQILQKYLPGDNVMAWQAQVKRGLIAAGSAPNRNAQ